MVKVSETPNRHQKTRTLLPVDWQYSCSLTAIPGLNASPRMAQLLARSMSQDTPPSLDGREPTPPFALSLLYLTSRQTVPLRKIPSLDGV